MNTKTISAIEYYQDVIQELINNGQYDAAQRVSDGMKRYVKKLLDGDV